MYLATKKVSCPGQNFADAEDYGNWLAGLGFDQASLQTWLDQKQAEGKLVYRTANLLDNQTVEIVTLWTDEAAHLEYEGWLSTTHDSFVDSLVTGGTINILSSSGQEV